MFWQKVEILRWITKCQDKVKDMKKSLKSWDKWKFWDKTSKYLRWSQHFEIESENYELQTLNFEIKGQMMWNIEKKSQISKNFLFPLRRNNQKCSNSFLNRSFLFRLNFESWIKNDGMSWNWWIFQILSFSLEL